MQTLFTWKSNKYYIWLCVCSLRYPNTTRMGHIAFRGLPTLQYFSILSHNGMIFEETLLNIKCLFRFSLYRYRLKDFSFYEEMSELWSKMYINLQVKWAYPLFLSDFKEPWIFSTDFIKILNTNFMTIRSVGDELFHAERRTGGQTDRTSLIVAFRNYANAPKKPPTS